jgi:DUF1680 family protein
MTAGVEPETTGPVVVETTHSPHARLRPVPITDVRLADRFWEPRRAVNREKTLASQFQHCEETGRLDNFRRAARKPGAVDKPFQGLYFNDSDVYKWLEAAAWSLPEVPDPALFRMVETAVNEIVDAQGPDGYLNTYFTFEREPERWTDLKNKHELYCAGHLIQAAIAHHRVTGSNRLLDVARRFADLICDTFGTEEGKRPGTPGHEEIEMALVELSRTTGDARYLRQAQYFLDSRGHGLIGGGEYHQDHKPVREQDRMTGHAVRHVYLCAGMADVAAETGEPELRTALDRLWDNMVHKQLYVSGGIGSRYDGEAFGRDYELPNERAYTETCAAIGSVMWSWRMLQIDGDSKYADVMETALYNAVLPGLSLDGQTYFYENPLADDGTHRRQPWFGCACCPPNIARLLASLPGYVYSVDKEKPLVHVHLYAEGEAFVNLPDGRTAHIIQHTEYPWGGMVEIQVNVEGPFGLGLRVPAWCEEGAQVLINGNADPEPYLPGDYQFENATWRAGTRIMLILPMRPRLVESHPYAMENAGRVALMRGPLLYCFEETDNPGFDLRDVSVSRNCVWQEEFRQDLLGGVVTLSTEATVSAPSEAWEGRMYRTVSDSDSRESRPVTLTAVPYYAWANREPGRITVWVNAAVH